MKNVLLLIVLSLCLFPSFSHSKSEETPTYESLVSDFMKFLQEGNLKASLRAMNDLLGKAHSVIEKGRMIWAIRKAIHSTSYNNGDNVLHLLIRLEQPETLGDVIRFGQFDPSGNEGSHYCMCSLIR